jgi:hypothetical protein
MPHNPVPNTIGHDRHEYVIESRDRDEGRGIVNRERCRIRVGAYVEGVQVENVPEKEAS